VPALAAGVTGVVAIAAIATVVAVKESGEPAPRSQAAPSWPDQPGLPVEVDGELWVDGEQVPGEWFGARGRGTRWISVRADRTWWWGNGARPRRLEGEVDQGPAISPDGSYLAYVVGHGPDWTLAGAETDEDGEGFGTVDLPRRRMSPAPRAVGVTDDGLVVVQGPDFQWVWRPLVDGGTVDLAETAPGQVVLDVTDAGLVVNEGRYGRTDRHQGAPYLARLDEDGTLTRLGSLPLHDALEAGERWLAYVSPGTIGGESWGAGELGVQHLDGSAAGVLEAPEGWLFAAPGFRWETPDRLLAPLIPLDGSVDALARCRPDRMTCTLVDLPD
jgi:hypothetical protein